jgi:hypothetical protein
MVAGLSVQVASLLLFVFMCPEFGWRVYEHQDQLNQKNAKIFPCCRSPFPFVTYFSLKKTELALATVTIFIHPVFRVAELSGGFGGPWLTIKSRT